ncbi:flagellar hook-basal body complex protein [Marinospirillum sp.]|uniref:flagellar hook protein FlgE n=1 Tax=Marinospirillum sp. TaxID=2183934 RepID=UPI00286FB900|nr:flagellar hook-basal body complex protein [Marinospirillum sp.]MDR9467967.1 flagellar hook-basal body complex protein [Marinospirillum sp.]
MSFNVGLSGLRGAQTDLSVTGNNIANASTTGFKQSRAEFGDVYNSSIMGTGKHSVGSGVLTERISQQHAQGNVNYTDRALDMAINGNGYFILSNDGQTEYSRAGYFDLDKDGFITNNVGKRLQGYEANLDGDIQSGALGDIQLTQTNIQPRASSRIDMELNLDSRSEIAGGATAAVPQQKTIDFTGNTVAAGGAGDIQVDLGGGAINITLAAGDDAATIASKVQAALDGEEPITAGNPVSASVSGNVVTINYDPADEGLVADGGSVPDTITTANAGATFTAAYAATLDQDSESFAPAESGDWDIANFDPNDRATYTDANSTSIYDSLGNEHVLRQYYIKVERSPAADGNAWAMIASLDGKFLDRDGNDTGLTSENWSTPGTPQDLVLATKFFNTQGDLEGIESHAGAGNIFDPDTDGVVTNTGGLNESAVTLQLNNMVNGAEFGQAGSLNGEVNFNFRGSTQYGDRFAVQSQSQDGYTTGRLAGLEVDEEGIIFGRYTNGQNKAVGQVPLATFTNPEGLKPNGSTAWVETTESGIPAINRAGAGITGKVEGGALEESNVDLSEELVKMIIAQRNYQANAKTIQTQDTLTQTIINLR